MGARIVAGAYAKLGGTEELLKALKEDATRMEEVCCRLAQPTDIWQDRFVYWIAVAVLHLLQAEIRRCGRDGLR